MLETSAGKLEVKLSPKNFKNIHKIAKETTLFRLQPKPRKNIQQKKLRGFSPPANYTDRATAACRQS
jgi:hypothetical protein